MALRISADTAAFFSCKVIGAQDTLYDHIGRHYFKDCYIEGSVDFIFGNGLSCYKDCHLNAITSSYGALTAQKRESYLEETGFSFVNCKVTGSGALYLGRAWGTFSRVVFAYTYMDKIITPKGWYDWGDKNREMYVCSLFFPLPHAFHYVPASLYLPNWNNVNMCLAGPYFMDNTSVGDQGLISGAEFHGRGSSLLRRLNHLFHLVLSMARTGSQTWDSFKLSTALGTPSTPRCNSKIHFSELHNTHSHS